MWKVYNGYILNVQGHRNEKSSFGYCQHQWLRQQIRSPLADTWALLHVPWYVMKKSKVKLSLFEAIMDGFGEEKAFASAGIRTPDRPARS